MQPIAYGDKYAESWSESGYRCRGFKGLVMQSCRLDTYSLKGQMGEGSRLRRTKEKKGERREKEIRSKSYSVVMTSPPY